MIPVLQGRGKLEKEGKRNKTSMHAIFSDLDMLCARAMREEKSSPLLHSSVVHTHYYYTGCVGEMEG